MCRIFGCVAVEPVSLRHELLEAPNPLIRQSEHHDSGWGMAVYERAEGSDPTLMRTREAAHAGGGLRLLGDELAAPVRLDPPERRRRADRHRARALRRRAGPADRRCPLAAVRAVGDRSGHAAMTARRQSHLC